MSNGAKYLFNMKFGTPANIDVSLSVSGDELETIIRDAVEAYAEFKAALWDHTVTQGKANGKAPAKAQAPVAKAQATVAKAQAQMKAEAPTNGSAKCPDHGYRTASKFGGFYCPAKLDDGTFCRWNDPMTQPNNG